MVLGPLLFLIYINDLSENIHSGIKLFADDSSLYVKVRNVEEAHASLTTDLETISLWANQWKMQFNPDITKQAIEVIFSSKHNANKGTHPPLVFGGIPVARQESTKHLGFYLDEKLDFKIHVSESIIKATKGLALLKFLSPYLNRSKLDLAYKMHIRPHLEYGDVIFHERSKTLMKSIESIQIKAAYIVAGCWKGTNTHKLYKELGWESLSDRRTLHRLSLYFKILNNKTPCYLRELVLSSPPPNYSSQRYKNSFFPFCYSKWQNLDPSIQNAVSVNAFKSKYIKLIRPSPNGIFNIRDCKGLSFLTRMRVTFSDLRDHRFNHNFFCQSPTCKCNRENETNEHFLLRCSLYTPYRAIFLRNIGIAVNEDIVQLPHDHLSEILLSGSPSFDDSTHKTI